MIGITDNPNDIPEGCEAKELSDVVMSKEFSTNFGRLLVKHLVHATDPTILVKPLSEISRLLDNKVSADEFGETLQAMLNDSLDKVFKNNHEALAALAAFTIIGTIKYGDLIDTADLAHHRTSGTVH